MVMGLTLPCSYIAACSRLPGSRVDKSMNSPRIIFAWILSGMGGRVWVWLLCLRLRFGRLTLSSEESESELSALLLEGSEEDGGGDGVFGCCP